LPRSAAKAIKVNQLRHFRSQALRGMRAAGHFNSTCDDEHSHPQSKITEAVLFG
jgi:hypothetical protein